MMDIPGSPDTGHDPPGRRVAYVKTWIDAHKGSLRGIQRETDSTVGKKGTCCEESEDRAESG